MPAYNEEATLSEIVGKVLKIPCLLELIIVDDCSTDETSRIAEELSQTYPQVRVAHTPKNSGKTEALKTGFALTRGSIVIVQDADLEYDPNEIFSVIKPIIDGHADVVYKAFRGDIIRNMHITSSGFGFEIEVTAKIAKLGCPIYEVPISYYGRTYEQGKKIGVMDGIVALWYVILFNLFFGLKSSFRTVPQLTSGLDQNEGRFLESQERQ